MRATLTVTAQASGATAPYKVTVKLWSVPRPMCRKLARACDVTEGGTRRRELLGGMVDVIYNHHDRSITLVKPAHTAHGLQGQFDALVGKSLCYRIRETRDAARKLAADGDYTPYEGNLGGCSPVSIYDTILRAVLAEASPNAVMAGGKPKKRRARRPVGVAA